MATGASTADAAVVLIDAAKGVLVQSRRHAYIASLLRVRHVLVSRSTKWTSSVMTRQHSVQSSAIPSRLEQIAADTGNPVEAQFVPVSALVGDNIVHRTSAMPWYRGPSLLSCLNPHPHSVDTSAAPFRFPVQRAAAAGSYVPRLCRANSPREQFVQVTGLPCCPSGRSAEVERIADLGRRSGRGARAAFSKRSC